MTTEEKDGQEWHSSPVSWMQFLVAVAGLTVTVVSTFVYEQRRSDEELHHISDRVTVVEQRQQNVLAYIAENKTSVHEINEKLGTIVTTLVRHEAETNGSKK